MNTKKTKQKSTKHLRLFRKYTKQDYLTYTQIKKLMKQEFKLVYNKHIMTSFMAIWSTRINKKQVITKSTFVDKLFKKPDGFFRDISL
tara:strand:- start:113 stop:376 length:264 start_codon:yes stop_codon:yes gene_type:complete